LLIKQGSLFEIRFEIECKLHPIEGVDSKVRSCF